MSSNVQQEDAWLMHVSSACSQSVKEEVATNELEASKTCAVVAHHNKRLTERDYIGLSPTLASASASITQNALHKLMCSDSSKCSDSREQESVCGDTELRLGIGPYNGDLNTSPTVQHGGHLVQSVPLKQAEGCSNASQYWCYGGMSGASSGEFHQSFWPWGPGVAPGRFMIPVPKISMVPAKRPYLEVMGENGNKASVSGALAPTNPNTLAEPATFERGAIHKTSSSSASPLPTSSSSQGGGFYAWSASASMQPNVVTAATWQHANCDQEGTAGALPVKSSCPTRALVPPPPLFKPCPVPQARQMPPVISNQPAAPHVVSTEERAAHTLETPKEDVSRNKSPMVGWPPVRSFRKNTLQSAAGLGTTTKGTGASTDVRNHEDTSKANESVADQQSKGSSKLDALFVKAKLDGVRICRKVDLASYSSYESLKAALQEMFQGFVCNDNAKLDLLHGENYVLTHEDKDGDMMLVGDVPWRMFITTVKSLRIMKAVDAVGLDGKVFTKLKAQD